MTTSGVRLFGVPHLPTAARQVAITFTNNLYTLNSSDYAYPSVGAAGEVWAPLLYLSKLYSTIDTWLQSALPADPYGVAYNEWAPVASLSLSETAGGSRVVLTVSNDGGDAGAVLSSITIDNTSGWATPLGLVEDGVSAVFTAAAGVVTITGQFQPRTLWCFPRAETDTGDYRLRANERTHPLADGDAAYFQIGGSYQRRDYTLLDQSPEHAGPPFTVARFGSWGATRKTINIATDNYGYALFFPSRVVSDLSLVSAHDYIQIGNTDYCCRVKGTTSSTITLYEPFPSSMSANAGDEINVISEAAAFELEQRRLGYAIVHAQDDLTDTPNYGAYSVYVPWSEGEWREASERATQEPLFNWSFNWLKYRKNKLTLP